MSIDKTDWLLIGCLVFSSFMTGYSFRAVVDEKQTEQIRADLDKREQKLQVRADLILDWEKYWERMLNMNDEKKYRLHEPHKNGKAWKGDKR